MRSPSSSCSASWRRSAPASALRRRMSGVADIRSRARCESSCVARTTCPRSSAIASTTAVASRSRLGVAMNAPRWVLIVLGIAVLVAAVDVAVFVVTRKGPTAAADATVTRDRVAVIDPAKNRVVDDVPVGRSPTAVVAGYGAVWVLNRGDGTLTHIDARTHKVVD